MNTEGKFNIFISHKTRIKSVVSVLKSRYVCPSWHFRQHNCQVTSYLNKLLLNMFSILPPIISPDHFVCTMGGVVFFVTILKWHPAASK
jgi:hypothetical protein